MLRIQMYRCSK